MKNVKANWLINFVFNHECFCYSGSDEHLETLELSEKTVNTAINEKIGPEHFELLKVLGKGGYGKVSF